jgi:Uma2 family endonuclease
MATHPITHPITVDQYLHSFEGCPGWRDELINGRIVMTPDAKPLHQHIQKNIQGLLSAACAGSGYIANGDSNIELTPVDMPSPDAFVVSWPAWRRAMLADKYLNVKPLLVVEILSPGQNVDEKVGIYLAARVDAIWVVDPKTRSVTFYEDQKPYREIGELALPHPLKGSIPVSAIFAGVPPISPEKVSG